MRQGFGMIKKLGLALALTVLPLTAQAATIDLASLWYERDVVVAEDATATVSVSKDPSAAGVLLFFAFDAFSELGVNSLDLTDLAQVAFVLFGPDLDDELSGSGATLFGSDDTDLVQFLFTGVRGEGYYAEFNGGAVLVEVQATGLLTFTDDFFLTDEGTITVTALQVIPLPAGLPLMLAGLGMLAVLQRVRPARRAHVQRQ